MLIPQHRPRVRVLLEIQAILVLPFGQNLKKKTNFNYLHILISRMNSIKMIFCNYVSIEKNSVEIQNLPSSFSFNGTENTPANRPTRMNLINIVQRVLFQGPSTSYIPIVLYTNRLCDKVHVASKCVSFHLLLLINLVE